LSLKNKLCINLIIIILLFALTGCNSETANSPPQKESKKDSIIISPTTNMLSTDDLTMIGKTSEGIKGSGLNT